MTRGLRFAEPVEVQDVYDRRCRYVIVHDEESDTTGVLWWDNRRLRCTCADGRQCYEDRLDDEHQAIPCAHERTYTEWLRRITQHSKPAPDYPASTAMWE